MKALIEIETESRTVEANGWVEAGAYYNAMFRDNPPGVKGCPSGRSQRSQADAIANLCRRTNDESGTKFSPADLVVVRHNFQLVSRQ